MILKETFTLSNGVEIPKLGFGTWIIPDGEAARVVRDAVEVGYRHFDTAQAYANERGVAEGLRGSGVPRDQFFVTTKLAAECKNYAEAKDRIDGSLEALGLDHIDLMLIHSPQPWSEFREGGHFHEGNLEAWRALEEAHGAGKLRAIGVSNFEREDLDNLLDNGAVLNNPALTKFAEKYDVGIAQMCIRYCLQLGLLPLPKTVNPNHMRSNAALDCQIASNRDPLFAFNRDPSEALGLGLSM